MPEPRGSTLAWLLSGFNGDDHLDLLDVVFGDRHPLCRIGGTLSVRRGFKPDAAAGSGKRPKRNHIRMRGWDNINIENGSAFRKHALSRARLTELMSACSA